jgi:SsrA-binding protein
MAPADTEAVRTAAQNRRARFDYEIEDTLEAGLVLTGSEVKSLRAGQVNIAESYATEQGGEIWLINSYIGEYKQAGRFGHEPKRPRKLLLKSREIEKLIGAVRREGATLVPLRLYFNRRGIAKLALGVARGKRKYEKREAEKKREWNRERGRLMREKG